MARAYIGAVLGAQALVAGVLRDVPPPMIVLGVLGALVLSLPLVQAQPSVRLRFLTVLPPVAVAAVWAVYASPLGSVAWVAWAVGTVWLCTPAGPGALDTLAERFHANVRTPRKAHRAPRPHPIR